MDRTTQPILGRIKYWPKILGVRCCDRSGVPACKYSSAGEPAGGGDADQQLRISLCAVWLINDGIWTLFYFGTHVSLDHYSYEERPSARNALSLSFPNSSITACEEKQRGHVKRYSTRSDVRYPCPVSHTDTEMHVPSLDPESQGRS